MKGKGEIPGIPIINFRARTLLRALGEEGVRELYEKYSAARLPHYRTIVAPTDEQRKISALAREVGEAEAARKLGIKPNRVYNSVTRVSRWDYLRQGKN